MTMLVLRRSIRAAHRVPSTFRLLGVLLVVGLGCSSPTELCACTYPPTAALQIGGVVTRAGLPASGLFVREETVAGSCQAAGTSNVAESLNVMARATQVDADGQYNLVVRIFDASAPVCVRLTAYAPGGPSGPADDLAQIERAGLRLRDSRVGGTPLDTLHVDFVLP